MVLDFFFKLTNWGYFRIYEQVRKTKIDKTIIIKSSFFKLIDKPFLQKNDLN